VLFSSMSLVLPTTPVTVSLLFFHCLPMGLWLVEHRRDKRLAQIDDVLLSRKQQAPWRRGMPSVWRIRGSAQLG